MAETLTLNSVQDDFKEWRQQKTKPRERVPESLRQKALALLDEVPAGRIQKALGISHDMLTVWSGKPIRSRSPVSQSVEFVSLQTPPQTLPHEPINRSLTISLSQASGNHWQLQGDASASQIRSFVDALSGGVL